MELAISLGFGGWLVIIAGALVFGVIAQFIGEARTGYEWLVDAIAAFAGAFIASEFVISFRAYEPVFDGLATRPRPDRRPRARRRRGAGDPVPDRREVHDAAVAI